MDTIQTKNPIRFDISLSEEQKQVKSKVLTLPVNFILGIEGTGKTMLGMNIALDLLFRKDTIYDKIIITRPIIAAEDFGYLPGNIKEKLFPFLVPIYETLGNIYGSTAPKKKKIAELLEREVIRVLPIAFTRGVSYNNAIVVVDEFQNCTPHQLEMIIGRLGKTSKLIFTGSKQQVDLKKKTDSCLKYLDKLKDNTFVSISTLQQNHRHEAVHNILNDIRR